MIDANRINEIFMDCLFDDDEVEDGKPKGGIVPVLVEGIISKMGFHPDRVRLHQKEIVEALEQLPLSFRKSSGGGMTFLNACQTKDDEQWTGLHQRMEQLFQLGMAIGKAGFCLPRDMWSSLPGGMPYVWIDV